MVDGMAVDIKGDAGVTDAEVAAFVRKQSADIPDLSGEDEEPHA